jgi:putative DNA primase/helicase
MHESFAERVCLSKDAPYDNALELTSSYCWHQSEGIRTLNYWQKYFWSWTGNRWREMDDEEVRAALWQLMNAAERFGKNGKRERFTPTRNDISSTLDALRGATNLPWSDRQNAMPGWFGNGQPDGELRELVACQNGILHIRTRKLIPHTPRFWSPNVLDFAYDPKARAPRFQQFLREVWPGDEEAQQCLLEMFGLCITDITKYQKAFMFVGPPRGGRGTIGRVLKALIGPSNYISTSMRAFGEQFGMESFIGKKVAVFSDARLDGVPQRILTNITERILGITGEDDQHVNRKNEKYWLGQLLTRLIIFTNELLRIQDQSGALPRRQLIFRMQESFPDGRADPDLTAKLVAECPGILNLALDALGEVRARGGLFQCKSGREMSESLQELSSDVSAFVEEVCIVGPEHEVFVRDLFQRWQTWCVERGVHHNWGENHFTAKLRAVVPKMTDSRPRDTPTRLTKLYGIAIRRMKLKMG